jgi:hypothetical protein
MLNKLCVLFLLFPSLVSAEVYVDIYGGHGHSVGDWKPYFNGELEHRVYFNNWVKTENLSSQTVIGYREGNFAFETGFVDLPTYHGYAEAFFPTRACAQDIRAHALFGRFVVSTKFIFNTQPYAFIGLAVGRSVNNEYGHREGIPVNFTSITRPSLSDIKHMPNYSGVGISYKINKKISLKTEYGVMNDVVKSHWTGDRAYKLSMFGMSYNF